LGTLGVAALTDFLDGYVARKQGKVTRMGQFLDPLADKICISAAFVMLALKGRIWSWVPEVIIGREVIITLFRIYAGSRGSSVPASVLGKLKTNSQLLALFLVLLHGEPDWYDVLEKSAMALAVALTLYSGYDYISKAGRYLPRRGEQDA
jgi:CDP-diacylglycerol--glycerol-3-phosphate 3-phosphatidyltransferase